MFILFSDHFFDMPDRKRVKARRKHGFGFGMITSDLDAPPSKGDWAVKMIISQMWRVKDSSDQEIWFWSRLPFSVHFQKIYITLNDFQRVIIIILWQT